MMGWSREQTLSFLTLHVPLELTPNSWLVPTCVEQGCGRNSVSWAFNERRGANAPVCRRHILAYRVGSIWQAEDEVANLRFCRRARTKAGAQKKILRDQRAALRGRESLGQLWMRLKADHFQTRA